MINLCQAQPIINVLVVSKFNFVGICLVQGQKYVVAINDTCNLHYTWIIWKMFNIIYIISGGGTWFFFLVNFEWQGK